MKDPLKDYRFLGKILKFRVCKIFYGPLKKWPKKNWSVHISEFYEVATLKFSGHPNPPWGTFKPLQKKFLVFTTIGLLRPKVDFARFPVTLTAPNFKPRNSGKLIISRAEIFSGEVLPIYLSDELGLERLRDFATLHII